MKDDPQFSKAIKAITREKMNGRRDDTQRKMNAFGSAIQGALLPDNDDAAKFGGMAPKFGNWKE
jgi:hypothetical protein